MRGSRNIRQGGPGLSFFSPQLTQLILQKSNGQFQRNLSFFKVTAGGGSNIFQVGGPTFSRWGVQLFPGVGPIAYSL